MREKDFPTAGHPISIEELELLNRDKSPESTQQMIALLGSEDPIRRLALCSIIERLGNEDTIFPIIESLVEDHDYHIREQVYQLLTALLEKNPGNSRAKELIEKMQNHSSRDILLAHKKLQK